MKLDIDAADLNRALIAPSRISDGVLRLSLAGDRLTILADDRVVRVTESVPVDGQDDGEAVVPAHLFHDLAKAMPDGPVHITASGAILELGGDGDDTIGPVQASMWQITDDRGALPPTPPDPPLVGDVDLEAFSRVMAQVLPAVSKDLSRPPLTAVSVRPSGGSLAIAATDSYRLHVTQSDMVDAAGWDHQALLPGDAIRWVLSVFDPTETATLHLDRDLISVRSDRHTLTARLVQGDFPSVKVLIPDHRKAAAHITVDAARFLDALDRVNPIAKAGGHRVSLTGVPEDGLVVLGASAVDFGESTATVTADVTGAGFTFGADIRYVTAAAKAAGGQRLDLWWAEDGQPILIGAFGDPHYRAVIMPLRASKPKSKDEPAPEAT
jgi:DNA polymerase-3 subunit beta